MQRRRTGFLTEALVKDTGNAAETVLVVAVDMDVVAMVLAMAEALAPVVELAPARCGNRHSWKGVSDNLRGLMFSAGKSCD